MPPREPAETESEEAEGDEAATRPAGIAAPSRGWHGAASQYWKLSMFSTLIAKLCSAISGYNTNLGALLHDC
jgi:hypothetical protein